MLSSLKPPAATHHPPPPSVAYRSQILLVLTRIAEANAVVAWAIEDLGLISITLNITKKYRPRATSEFL